MPIAPAAFAGDHRFSGEKITKSPKNWLARNLAPQQRSRIMFMDRDDILNLFISSKTPRPAGALLQSRKMGSTIGMIKCHSRNG